MAKSATPASPAVADDDRPPEAVALEKKLVSEHAVRLHLGCILVACFGAGLVVTKLMLLAGVHAMWIRYALANVAGYATFLLGIRLWLAWMGYGPKPALSFGNSGGGSSGSSSSGGSWSWGGGKGGGSGFGGGGGGSGGGGASASFAESSGSGVRGVGFIPVSTHAGASSGGKSGGGFSLDGDGDGIVLVLLIALVAAVFGAAAYVIYAAPTILSDAAFAALLSGGLVRSARRMSSDGWVGSVIHDTRWPFLIVFATALAFALAAQHYYPDAQTIRDVIRHL
jgi:hypothetical protein